MKKLSFVLLISSFVFTQDSTFVDTLSIEIDSLSNNSKSSNITKSYNNFEWGLSFESFVIDSTYKNVFSDTNHVSYDGFLGKDSVRFIYSFKNSRFWKVDIYYLSTLRINQIDSLISKFYEVEQILFLKYGSPMRTSQNEIGSNREYNFSDFPKVNRVYYRSSWSLENINIELVLDNIVETSKSSIIFENFKRPLSLYYYDLNYFENDSVDSDTTEFSNQNLLDNY